MASQKLKELELEYVRLNRLASQTTNELDHKSLMALIESFDLYVQKEILKNQQTIMEYNQH
jgi:hypothetical protein